MARPEKPINVPELERLAEQGTPQEDIAKILLVSVNTLDRRYGELIAKSAARGREKLRAKQYELAIAGNVTMLIWLGKQWLGQTDKNDLAVSGIPIKQFEASTDLPASRARFGYAHKPGGNGNGNGKHKGNGDGQGDEDNSRPEETQASN